MKKLIFVVVLTFLFAAGCTSQKTISSQRRALIGKAINAISKYDTSNLYDLLDTTFCFNIYGKEGFLQKVDFIHNKFRECDDLINDTSISIQHTRVRTTEYVLPFCTKRNINTSGTFTVILSFADDQNDSKILFLDFATQNRAIKPTVPIPKE